MKGERDSEIVQMENIILELQLELYVFNFEIFIFIMDFLNRRQAREEAELKRKKSQQSGSTTPPKTSPQADNRKEKSPTTPTNASPVNIDM